MALRYVEEEKSMDLQLHLNGNENENGDSKKKGNSTQATTKFLSMQCFPLPPSSTYTTVRARDIQSDNEASDSDMTGSPNDVPNHTSAAFLGELEARISMLRHSRRRKRKSAILAFPVSNFSILDKSTSAIETGYLEDSVPASTVEQWGKR